MKKYELTSETKEFHGKTLHRIKALKSFGDVKAGDLGGWIESENNLSQDGSAWVADSALVADSARVADSALVTDFAWVTGSAWVAGFARVTDSARVGGSAWVTGSALVGGSALVTGFARVTDSARVTGSALVTGSARVGKNTHVFAVGAIGSRDDTVTFFRAEVDGKHVICVSCGCFRGAIDEFAEQVKKTHGDSKHAKTYAMAIELAKMQIEDVDE